jgi:hypothetical protein
MKTDAAPISLAGSEPGDTRQLSALFSSDDEQHRVLLPFMNDGFDRGDKTIRVVKLRFALRDACGVTAV